MNTSRRFGLFGRSSRNDRKSKQTRSNRAARLAAASGGATGAHGLEELEARQLLFTVTIGPGDVNPATGLGTRTVDFSYVVPYLGGAPTTTGQATQVLENFDDEMANWTTAPVPVPPNGTRFAGSNIQVSYQSTNAAAVQLTRRPVGNNQVDQALRVALTGTDNLSFQFADPQAQGNNLVSAVVNTATFTFSAISPGLPGDGGGLNTDANLGTRVELLANGVVVQTFSGAALAALAQTQGNFTTFTFAFGAGFDQVRFSSAADAPNNTNYSDIFVVEAIQTTIPPTTMWVDSHVRDVRLTFTGPAGASVQLLDLYGRDMRQVDMQRIGTGDMTSPIDRNRDNIPDFNDGIGRVVINGTNAQSSISMVGYIPDPQNQQLPKDFPQGPADTNRIIETVPFGYELILPGGTMATGLPLVGSSLVIGSPWVRDNTSPNTYLRSVTGGFTADDFNRADQGVFVNGGASIGSVLIMGVVHGSSRIDGAAGRWSVGFMPGSLRVDGDLGVFTSQSETGGYATSTNPGVFVPTGSRITIGRTVREFSVAGRNLSTVSVLADVNNPARARIVQRDYVSREAIYPINPAANDGARLTIFNTINNGATWASQTGRSQATPFGAGYYRNDDISSAEFVGYNGTSVRIFGAVNGQDPINAFFDSADVYAFPADSLREIVIASPVGRADYIRLVDRDGRVLAALDDGGVGRGPNGNNSASGILRYRPDHADVYYLVVNSGANAQNNTDGVYQITITGMAPVTLGAFRVGAGATNNANPYVFTLASGDMGSARIGTGYFRSDGTQSNTTDVIVTNIADARNILGWGASTLSAPGNLYNVFVGAGVNGAQLLVNGDLGTFVTGSADSLGRSNQNGDLYNADIRVGGGIALFDVKGAMAVNQIPAPDARNGAVSILTGRVAGRKGDIGRMLIGAYMQGPGVTIRTSAGSQFDQLIVGADNGGAGSEFPAAITNGVPLISVGDGSDVRFFTFSTIATPSTNDSFDRVVWGQTRTFVDDAGASITISFTGPEPLDPTNDARVGSFVDIRLLAVNGSRGAAIASLTANLVGGANLVITGNSPGVVSIGRILITNAAADAGGGGTPATPAPNPSIIIQGQTQIDVYKIDVATGILDSISNTTPGGDIVAIDAAALRTITINGNLGRTQTIASNTSLLGPFLGIVAGGGQGGIGGPIGLNANTINVGGDANNWATGSAMYTPVTAPGIPAPNQGYLEDVGSPVDPYLNGVIVRAGDLENVSVNGTVGDVLVQGGHLISLVANADGITPQGDFQGIVGNIYAIVIGRVDVGDGLAGSGVSPFAEASIVADQGIVRIFGGTRYQGVTYRGIIMTAGVGGPITQLGTSVANPEQFEVPIVGIGRVELTNGRYDTALVYAGAMDDFWHSTRTADVDRRTTNIDTVQANNSAFFRSQVWGVNIAAVAIAGGAFDASVVDAANNGGSVTADSFSNSTRLGNANEFFPNRISALNNFGSITTNGLAGDMSDLAISLRGSLTGQIAARNIDRSDIAIINLTTSVRATQDVRSTTIETGRLASLAAGGSIRSTSLRVAGPIESVTAGNEITQLSVNSSGPDGRVDLVRAQNLLNADVTSSGSIGTIESVNNDVVGSIVTRNDDVRANNGGLTTLRAGRDLIVGLSILGDTGTITAVRNIGTFGVLNPDLDLRGNLGSISATGGQIYSDLLVGQSITGTVTIGRVSMKPGNDQTATSDILAFGRINAIVINNDFNGNITSRSGGIGSITFNSGSFRPGHAITVNNGDLTQLTLNGGDLLGNVLVDGNIGGIDVKNGPDGFKGQIGIASWRRNSKPIPTDPLRNELPPGVQRSPNVDGVTIKAGGSIDHVTVQQGSFTESQIIAGTTIGLVDIALQLRNDALNVGLNNAIVAGDSIGTVRVGGFVGAVGILAGVIDLGTDGRVGGIGSAADTVKSGTIGSVTLNTNGVAKTVNSVIAAGISPDATGKYNTVNATSAAGRSSIGSVSANNIIGVSAYAAGTLGPTTAGIVRGGTLPATDPTTLATNSTITEVELANGVGFLFQLPSGQKGVATLSGPGRAFYDPALGRLRLANTTTATSLTIVPNGSFLDGIKVLGNANSALGTLSIGGTLRGSSTVFINGDVTTLTLSGVDALGGLFGSGGNINSLTTGNFLAGILRGRTVNTLTVNGDLGRSTVDSDAFIDMLSIGSATVTGVIAGALSSDRSITTLTAGSMSDGGVRAGLSIGSVTTGTMAGSRIVARNSLGNVVVNGDATSSQIFAGADLGHDADYGGTGRDTDVLGAGSITSLRVNGNFRKSDVGAGVMPGPSGFLGSADVTTSAGRSSIGTVTITGTQVGSTLNSEQYRVLSTGTIGAVTVGGAAFTGTSNFRVERITAVAVPVRVLDLFVTEGSRIYTANIVFNQPMDASTLSAALSVVEVRNGGATTIGLAEGTDYTIEYDKARNTAKIIFSRSVTERNLPLTPGIPGPGVYQIILSAQVLRGSTQDSLLDGNGDGQPGDDFASNVIVGDAGDKITAGKPASAPSVDFYAAADLDLVLRKFANVGSVADTNTTFTITGSIGDHPDSDPDFFRLGGDVDLYRVTLQAGQILKMGQMKGTALGATRAIYNASGAVIASNSPLGATGGAPGAAIVRLPNNVTLDLTTTSEDQYLVTQTGTYFIAISGNGAGNIADVNSINNTDPVAGAFGIYSFTITVFDDGNTGFVGDTNSGTSAPLVTPPLPIVFAGIDGIFGNANDLKTYTVGDWVFRLTGNGGPASVVTGTNSQGWTVTRSAAPNGTFGSANDRIVTTIKSSIGLSGASGVPDEVSPDVDIFSINNGLPLAPGTKIRATLRLTNTGSNIGLTQTLADPTVLGGITLGQDLLGHAQFALFETPVGTGFNNAKLVAAPSDFLPIGGQTAKTVTDGRNTYGYDATGDFFMEFVVPGAQGISSPVPASYSLYLQGAIRSDYTLEIVQQGTGSTTLTPQNVFLETNGGLIDWLEAGAGVTTALSAFSSSAVGFTGQINGQAVDTYVLNNLVASLNSVFTAANVNIVISTNPNDFARQSFSTVFLAGNVEPNAFFGNGSYGASQKVDFFNVDKNDQAVVFIPALADIGFEPTNAGVDRFVSALTGAVARRIGELVGLRLETAVGGAASPVPVMASDSVAQAANSPVGFNDVTRNLAGLADNAADTVFYLGTQNAGSLIRQVVIQR